MAVEGARAGPFYHIERKDLARRKKDRGRGRVTFCDRQIHDRIAIAEPGNEECQWVCRSCRRAAAAYRRRVPRIVVHIERTGSPGKTLCGRTTVPPSAMEQDENYVDQRHLLRDNDDPLDVCEHCKRIKGWLTSTDVSVMKFKQAQEC